MAIAMGEKIVKQIQKKKNQEKKIEKNSCEIKKKWEKKKRKMLQKFRAKSK